MAGDRVEREAGLAAAAVERRRLADVLDGLESGQWDTPSLCEGWSVRVVVGHLVAALDPSTRPLLTAVLHARGDLHRGSSDLAHRVAAQAPATLVDLLRRRADNRIAPPVTGVRGPLTDVVVHTGDICRPLGLPHEPHPDSVRLCLDFVTTGRPVGFVPRGLLRGVRLCATDLHRCWGQGMVVTGRGADLLMVACGRRDVLPDLTGARAAGLEERLRPR